MAKEQWKTKEDSDAKLLGAKKTPRSGGLWFAKGDSKSEKFLIENKTSANERFSITSKIWEKIEREALLERRTPILSIEFGEKKHEIVVLDKNDFIGILKVLEDYKLT